MLFQSIGKLKYFDNPYKLIVEVDNEIARYYRSFIPKYLKVNKPMYPAHISTVRREIPNLEFWGKYQGKDINFQYENIICNDEVYYWLGAFSKELQEIRTELGLPITSWITEPPDGLYNFHITIGNTKNKM